MIKKIFLFAVILLAASIEVAKGETPYSYYQKFKGSNNNSYSSNYTPEQRNNVKETLTKLDTLAKDHFQDIKDWYEPFATAVSQLDNDYSDDAVARFMKYYEDNDIYNHVNNFSPRINPDKTVKKDENHGQTDGTNIVVSPITSGLPSVITLDGLDKRINTLNSQIEGLRNQLSGQTKLVDDLNDKFYLLSAIIAVLFIVMLILYYILNLKLQSKASKNWVDYQTKHVNNNNNNNSNQQSLRKSEIMSSLKEDIKNEIEKKFKTLILSAPPTTTLVSTPISTTSPTPPTPPTPTQSSILYVTLDASNDTLFKPTSQRTDQHLYEIHLKNPTDSYGDLHLCQNIKTEFQKKFIGDRQSYLKICDINSQVPSPSSIVMKAPGSVIKKDNQWVVSSKPKIDLV